LAGCYGDGGVSTVVVHSKLENRVRIAVHELLDPAANGGIGLPGVTSRRVSDWVEIVPGRNEVDGDFWREWSEQNKVGTLADFLKEEKTE
jgi:hypothetical protein